MSRFVKAMEALIFASRWLQAPLYLGLIGISSIQLLKTFINAEHTDDRVILWQVAIHLCFLVSAIALAVTDRIMTRTLLLGSQGH